MPTRHVPDGCGPISACQLDVFEWYDGMDTALYRNMSTISGVPEYFVGRCFSQINGTF